MLSTHSYLATVLLLCAPIARASDLESRILDLTRETSSFESRRAALVADPAVSNDALQTLALDEDWQVRDQARAILTWRRYPRESALAWEQDAERTRAGFLRFPGGPVLDPAVGPVLLERYVHGQEPSEVQKALLDALVRSEADWDEAVTGLLPSEPQSDVRASLVFALRKVGTPAALQGLELALKDPSSLVRAEAARSIGRNPEGQTLVPALTAAMGDSSSEVRAMAARSLGWLRASEAWDPLLVALSDPEADVRLQALHALDRLDRQRLAPSPELGRLLKDPDEKVRLAAEHILKP